jgi:hypothetical protein
MCPIPVNMLQEREPYSTGIRKEEKQTVHKEWCLAHVPEPCEQIHTFALEERKARQRLA